MALLDLSVETDDEPPGRMAFVVGVPVVVFTGASQAERMRSLARGARLVLRKPGDIMAIGESLLHVVRTRAG